MNGADYVAMTRITTKAGDVLAMPGETCERVPTNALAVLAGGGSIAIVSDVALNASETIAPIDTEQVEWVGEGADLAEEAVDDGQFEREG
jgi:hypothetical protein